MLPRPGSLRARAAEFDRKARQLRAQASEIEQAERRRQAAEPVDRLAVKLADGSPVPPDQSHTALKANGQQAGYVVLSDEERAKGWVRPYRDTYRHVGLPRPGGLRDLTAEESDRYASFGYAKFEPYSEDRAPLTGRFWTQAELDRLGGCGQTTTMGRAIAETYARDPRFYGGTFCVTCGKHFSVGEEGEFVWVEADGRDGPRVGS